MKTRYIRGDEGEAHHIQSGLILRLHLVFDSRYAHNELLESCRFLMSNFSILEHFAAHLEFFRFHYQTIKSCNSIKYFLFSLRAIRKSAAMPTVMLSRFSLKNKKFTFSKGAMVLKFSCLAEIFSINDFLMKAREGQTNRWCSSFSRFRV